MLMLFLSFFVWVVMFFEGFSFLRSLICFLIRCRFFMFWFMVFVVFISDVDSLFIVVYLVRFCGVLLFRCGLM